LIITNPLHTTCLPPGWPDIIAISSGCHQQQLERLTKPIPALNIVFYVTVGFIYSCMNLILRVFLASSPIFFAETASSQKQFKVQIRVPSYIDVKKVHISYHDGKQETRISKPFSNNTINFSAKYYARYAVIMVTYMWSERLGYNNQYFIQQQPASIKFRSDQKAAGKNPLEKAMVINALDINNSAIAKRLTDDVLQESNDANDYWARYGDVIGSNDSIAAIYTEKATHLNQKKLVFIERNKNDYYSFWIFRNEVLGTLEPVLLLDFYKKVFPKNITNSIEGQETYRFLNGQLYTKKNDTAPFFESKDITGKMVSLKKYRGKYVLLDFWASWCVPCMEEVPQVNAIRKTYPKNKLQIIGVSSDSDPGAFRKAIKKFSMNSWTHIFGDQSIQNAYGNKPIPTLYLVDKKGIIIYSSWEDNYETLDLLLSDSLKKNN